MVAEVATLVSELTVGVDETVETVTVSLYFGVGVCPVPFRSVRQIVGQIMADAVLDRLDFDRAQILDQARMRGLAVERLEATGERARERKRRKDGESF